MLGRTIALTLVVALVAGCSGNSRLLPGVSPGTNAAQSRGVPDRREVRALVRIRIPRRSRGRAEAHPSTISPLTHSVSIAVNTAKAQIFDTTPSSPGCVATSKGTECSFAVDAQAGTDTFTVTTYAGVNATGGALDRGVAKVIIVKGKPNSIAVTLGPVVTTTANSGPGSLRNAIGSAGSGDTIMFLLPGGATITLATPITVLGNVKLAGPDAAKLAISGGGTQQLFINEGTLAISGLTLAHGAATVSGRPGGVIYSLGALSLASDIVGSSSSSVALRRAPHARRALRLDVLRMHRLHPHCSTTYNEGGAIYNAGALTIVGTTFSNNVVESDLGSCIEGEGGAIFNDVAGTLSSTSDTYTGNAGAAGGAVFNVAAGAATFNGDTFSSNVGCTATTGCLTSGCSATTCTTAAVGNGAAIADSGTGINVSNSKFLNNVAGGKTAGSQGVGGAIYLDSQLPTITNSTFSGNVAGGGTTSCSAGGGGAIVAANTVELDNDVFTNNSATGDNTSEGGAVAALGSITGTGDTFTGNKVVASGGPCTAIADAAGGAVYGTTGGTQTFTKSTFTGNTVVANYIAAGGGLGGADNVILNGCTFSSNTALATGAFGATTVQAAGGAFYSTVIGKVSSSTFTSNSATIEGPDVMEVAGGALAVVSGSFISNGSVYKSNSVVEKTGAQIAAGGAVAVVSGEIISSGDTFTSNSVTSTGAAEGGALLVSAGGLIANATVSSNKASGLEATGGGLALTATGSMEFNHVTVSSNAANGTIAGAGGGVFDQTGSTWIGSTIAQNTASLMGGGIFSESGADSLTSTSVTDNAVTKASGAASGGGGIYDLAGLDMEQVTVAGNTVTASGAGPAGGGGILNSGGILMLGTTISGNKVLGTATSGDGGGGILSSDVITAINSTISNNTSSMHGGGLYHTGSSMATFVNSTLYANTATLRGGNLDNLYQVTLTNSVVGGGHAGSGGGNDVYNSPSATLTSNGYDIFGSTFVGGGTYTPGTNDKFANPNLLPLANNGGPTFTNADRATSPGKGYIPYSGANCGGISTTTDQRGFTRGAGGKCDAGAYEYAGVATAFRHAPLSRPAFRHRAPRIRLLRLTLRALLRVDASSVK